MGKQLVQPNIEINEKAGLCLQYSRRVFGLAAVEPTAWDAWSKAKYRHADRNFPEGLAVPVWFDWWGQLPGDKQKFQYGHVAVRTADGKIWSSPLVGVGRAWFASVDDLTRAFGNGMTYVGWSEDISGTRVVTLEQGDSPMDEWDVKEMFISMLRREATEADVKAWVGLRPSKLAQEVRGGNEWLTQNHYVTYFTQNDKTIKEQEAVIQELRSEVGKTVDRSELQKAYESIGKVLGKQ